MRRLLRPTGIALPALLLDDLDVVMGDLARRGVTSGMDLRLPPTFTAFAP